MGRKNIERQIHTRLSSKIAFGQSKRNDKKNLEFGKSTGKIYSFSTYGTYLKVGKEYASWLRTKGINYERLDDTQKYAKDYISARFEKGISVYTLKMEKSALSMIYGITIVKVLPNRDKSQITRSRNVCKMDKHISRNGKYKDVFVVACATGCRRKDLNKITINSLKKIHDNYYLEIIGSKGGRNRLAPVLKGQEIEVLHIFTKCKAEGRNKLFQHIPKEIDVHSLRHEYARELYKNITENNDLRNEYLKQYQPREEKVQREIYRDRQGNVYMRDDIYVVSQALGHNRLEVSLIYINSN